MGEIDFDEGSERKRGGAREIERVEEKDTFKYNVN